MERKMELRFLRAREVRVKRDEGKPTVMMGYAAVFNEMSDDLGGFRETIQPGAFTNTLKDADVRQLINHDPNLVLGRTKPGTLRLKEDDIGLAFEVDLPDTSYARDLAVSVERGDIDQNSFGFYCLEDDWAMLDSQVVRTLKNVELFDTSIATYPAYPQTSVSMRSADVDTKLLMKAAAVRAKAVGVSAEDRTRMEMRLRVSQVSL